MFRSLWVITVICTLAVQAVAEQKIEPIVTKQSTFSIPFTIGDPEQQPAEVHLYVSADHASTWSLYQKQAPYANRFHFRAGKDGEYCFAVRTVLKPGQEVDMHAAEPELIVTVDTLPPRLKIRSERIDGGMVGLTVRAEDLHLDADSVLLELRDEATSWQPLKIQWEPVDQTDGFWHAETSVQPKVTGDEARFRVTMKDAAGNRKSIGTVVTLERSEIAATTLPAEEQARNLAAMPRDHDPPRTSNNVVVDGASRRHVVAKQSDKKISWNDPVDEVPDWRDTQPASQYDYASYASPADNRTDYQEITSLNRSADDRPLVTNTSANRDDAVQRSRSVEHRESEQDTAAPMETAGRPVDESKVQMTSEAKLQLDYSLDDVGPKGVGRVDIWITEDGGASWYAYGRDRDLTSPAEVEIEREGVYGFRLVVESKDGFAGQAPRDGEPSDVWIGVDWTRPSATITSARYGQGSRRGYLQVEWEASDENLLSRPIDLKYASSPEGPWETIGSEMQNLGSYDWKVDRRVPRMMYLRLEVRDKAGNVAYDQLEQPINSAGLAPKGRIRLVRPVGRND